MAIQSLLEPEKRYAVEEQNAARTEQDDETGPRDPSLGRAWRRESPTLSIADQEINRKANLVV